MSPTPTKVPLPFHTTRDITDAYSPRRPHNNRVACRLFCLKCSRLIIARQRIQAAAVKPPYTLADVRHTALLTGESRWYSVRNLSLIAEDALCYIVVAGWSAVGFNGERSLCSLPEWNLSRHYGSETWREAAAELEATGLGYRFRAVANGAAMQVTADGLSYLETWPAGHGLHRMERATHRYAYLFRTTSP